MMRFAVLAVLLVVAWTAPTTEDANSADFRVVGVNGIEELLAEKPVVEFALGMEFKHRMVVTYSFGKRGGPFVHTLEYYRFYQNYTSEQDVKSTLNYPKQGNGAVVTLVEIIAIQDSKEGRAYIVSGGINQRNISITIEANHTKYFRYVAQVFGYYRD